MIFLPHIEVIYFYGFQVAELIQAADDVEGGNGLFKFILIAAGIIIGALWAFIIMKDKRHSEKLDKIRDEDMAQRDKLTGVVATSLLQIDKSNGLIDKCITAMAENTATMKSNEEAMRENSSTMKEFKEVLAQKKYGAE